MKLIFGASIGASTENEFKRSLKTALRHSTDAIELGFTALNEIHYSAEIVDIFKQFTYRSIHLPVVYYEENQMYFLTYPHIRIENSLKVIDKFIEQTNPHTVVMHPDQIVDFTWAVKRYGPRLAFENMDKNKQFGKTLEDMSKVFEKCPSARWVFDLNHIYTNDNSMQLAHDFYNLFSNRLAHYHISGYGGFHDALCRSKEEVIVKGIISPDFPIIDEGDIVSKGLYEEELEYIKEKYKS